VFTAFLKTIQLLWSFLLFLYNATNSIKSRVLPFTILLDLLILLFYTGYSYPYQMLKKPPHLKVAPLFPNVLNPGSLTALVLVNKFSSPAEWLKKSNRKIIMTMLEILPRHGKLYAQKTRGQGLCFLIENKIPVPVRYSTEGLSIRD
jgi:hypothetical protein